MTFVAYSLTKFYTYEIELPVVYKQCGPLIPSIVIVCKSPLVVVQIES